MLICTANLPTSRTNSEVVVRRFNWEVIAINRKLLNVSREAVEVVGAFVDHTVMRRISLLPPMSKDLDLLGWEELRETRKKQYKQDHKEKYKYLGKLLASGKIDESGWLRINIFLNLKKVQKLWDGSGKAEILKGFRELYRFCQDKKE